MTDEQMKIIDEKYEEAKRLIAEGKSVEAENVIRALYGIAARMDAKNAAEVTYG